MTTDYFKEFSSHVKHLPQRFPNKNVKVIKMAYIEEKIKLFVENLEKLPRFNNPEKTMRGIATIKKNPLTFARVILAWELSKELPKGENNND